VLLLFLAGFLSPAEIWAAYNTVTHESGSQIALTDKTITVGTSTVVESYTVDGNSMSFTVDDGSIINLTAPVYFTLTPPDTIRISAVNTGSVVKIGGHLNGMLKQTFIDSSSVFNYTKTGIHFLGFTNSWSYADNFESSDEPGTR